MSVFGLRMLLTVAVLFAVIQSGLCRKCYTCQSETGSEEYCGTEYELDTSKASTMTCPSSEDWCRTEALTVDDHTKVSRGCGTENYCDGDKRLFIHEHCSVCQEDYCNSSSGQVPFLILGIVSLIIVKFVAILTNLP